MTSFDSVHHKGNQDDAIDEMFADRKVDRRASTTNELCVEESEANAEKDHTFTTSKKTGKRKQTKL